MRVLSIFIAVALGIGCLAAAIWLSQQTPPPTPASASQSGEPALPPGATKGTDDEKPIPKVAAEGPYPKAVLDGEPEYNFGMMEVGDHGHKVFVLRNEGEAPLEVIARERDSTCQCTVGKVANDEPIPPGGEVTVELKWEVKSSNPNFRHSAKVRTNDPDHQVIELAITGAIDQKYHLRPPGLWNFGEVTGDEPAKLVGALYSRTQDKFEISEFSCTSPHITATWEPMTDEELKQEQAIFGYRVNLVADLKDAAGLLQESASLKVMHDPNGEPTVLPFSIKASRPGPFEIIARHWDPEHSILFLGEFPASEGRTGELSFYTHLDEDVHLVSAKSEHDAVKTTWTKDEKYQSKGKTQRYVLKLEVPPGQPVRRQRMQSEKVELKFDHPAFGEMALFVDYLSL